MQLIADMFHVFRRLHPDIVDNDRAFEARDPIRPLRESLDTARLKRMLAGTTGLQCLEETRAKTTNSPALLFDGHTGRTRLIAPQFPSLASLPVHLLPANIAAFNTVLARLAVTRLQFENCAALDSFARLARGRPMELGLQVELGIASAA
jgi:hypothetical protein